MRSLFLFAAFACLTGVTVIGCGGASCDTPRCNADPRPNDAVITTCKNIKATKCEDPFNAWASCVDEGTKCDPATKRTDPATTLDALKLCLPKYDAMQSCCATYQTACPTAR